MGQIPPRPRSSWGPAVLAGLVICASSVGILLYQLEQDKKPEPQTSSSFDLSQLDTSAPGNSAPAANPAAQPQASGLALLKPGLKLRFSRREPAPGTKAPSGQNAAAAFAEAVRRAESQAHALALSYTRRYPSIRQYGRDWMSYPDLKKLNDDYMRDHDPVRFLRGLVRSPNFIPLSRKYAADPAIQSFVKQAIREAPGSLLGAALGFFEQDKPLQDMVAGGPLGKYLPFVKPDGTNAPRRYLALPDQKNIEDMGTAILQDGAGN
ncbi:MAG: hypothetical protein PHF00_03495 [Elusimicrobia bacterium]|nr:hypothetical protein [Elusimicrobiota bacterium]